MEKYTVKVRPGTKVVPTDVNVSMPILANTDVLKGKCLEKIFQLYF